MNKKILKNIVAGAIVVVAFVTVAILNQSAGAQNYTSADLVKTDGSGSKISKFQVATKDLNNQSSFFTNLATRDSIDSRGIKFRLAGDAQFDEVFAFGNAILNAVEPGIQEKKSLGNSVNIGFKSPDVPNIASLQINGDLQLESIHGGYYDENVYCVCATSGGTLARCGIYDSVNKQCPSSATPPTSTYSWDELGDWGACTGFATDTCSDVNDPTKDAVFTNYTNRCTGSYVETDKIDWNREPYEWIEGERYRTSNFVSFSAPEDISIPHEMVDLYFHPDGSCYELYVSGGLWRYDEFQVDYVTGIDGDYGYQDASCNWNSQRGTSQLLITSENPTASAYANLINSCASFSETQCNSNSNCSWEQVAVSTGLCSNEKTELACLSHPECGWTAASDGVQTQTVVCKDEFGTVVNDSLCTDPKPSATRSCTPTPDEEDEEILDRIIDDNTVLGCYPLQYSEVGGNVYTDSAYANARQFCSNLRTKTNCMSGSYYWNQDQQGDTGSVATWGPPMLAVEPYPGIENEYAIHSYARSQVIVDMGDLDYDGLPMPYYEPFCSNHRQYDGSVCYRSLGPVCVWGLGYTS